MSLHENAVASVHWLMYSLVIVYERFLFVIFDMFRPLTKYGFEILCGICGVKINGKNHWDLKVKDERAFAVIFSEGTCGYFKCFADNYVECEDIESFFDKLFGHPQLRKWCFYHPSDLFYSLINKYFDIQTIQNAWKSGGEHYDYGVDLYKATCGPSLLYSSLNFDETDDIEEASVNQMKLIAEKLNLQPGMHVLDVGCGYGTLCEYLASHYDVKVTGVTVSKNMANFARERCKKLNVEILEMDFRLVEGKFDRITCIEMSEHLGEHRFREFYTVMNRLLLDEGIFLLQVVTVNDPHVFSYFPIFEKFIGMRVTFPSVKHIVDNTSGLFVFEHMQNIGYNYGLTWSAWLKSFKKNWHSISHFYNNRFYRVWSTYLALGSSVFRTRVLHLNQIVFSKRGLKGGYRFNRE